MARKIRKVLGITGIRSEYFLQKPVFQAIQDHPNLELQLVVTGAHLSPLHGETVRDVEADGFPIVERIESLLWANTDTSRIKGAALQLTGFIQTLDRLRPDWVIAPADREEALVAAAAASYLNIPIAHLSAGDRVVGNVDDMVRHAVSKLSHLLLATNEDARVRLIKSGEQESRTFNVGHPGLDRFRKTPDMSWEEICKNTGLNPAHKQFIVMLQHVITSETEQAAFQIEETFKAIQELKLPCVAIYPNSDAGLHDILKVFDKYKNLPYVKVFKNIPDPIFVNLLRRAVALVGNSSLGLLEAPYLKLPVINVGNRQQMRHHASNVVFLPHDFKIITAQLKEWLDDPKKRAIYAECDNPFGDGHTGERIANLLATMAINEEFLSKDLTY